MYKRLLILAAFALSTAAWGDTPAPFMVRYDATYGGFTAESSRSLGYDAVSSRYIMRAQTSLVLLGSALTTIEERSEFRWDGDTPRSLQYDYEQSGLGARTRSVTFDQEHQELTWSMDDKRGTLQFDPPVYDDLNSFMEIRRQLQEGLTEIELQVAEKNEIKVYRYQVLGEEIIDTALGSYRAVHLERVRDPTSDRTTELWLARDMDYLLLKLRQKEPDGRIIELDAREIERDTLPSSQETAE